VFVKAEIVEVCANAADPKISKMANTLKKDNTLNVVNNNFIKSNILFGFNCKAHPTVF
jgi:hypothetical protein